MKRKSIIRVLLGMAFMVCLCHVGFAREKTRYNGIPMQNAYKSSLKYPVYLHLFVGDEIGCPLAYVGVRVKYEIYYRFDSDILCGCGSLINSSTPGNGELYKTEKIMQSQSGLVGELIIDIYYLGTFYDARCKLRAGPTYIEIKINRSTLTVTAVVTYPNNDKQTINFKC